MKIIFIFLFFCISFFGHSIVDHWETVVNEDDVWRYTVPNSPVSTSWITLGFNDASWNTGQGGFGYGDGDDNTVIPASISCYQRIIFNIIDINAIDEVLLNIDYDDSFVAYLNGVEIARNNITSFSQPPYNQLSDGLREALLYSGGVPSQFVIGNSLLQNGANVLCIQTHNQAISSSDMSSRTWLSLGINNTSTNYGSNPIWFNPPLIFTSSNLPIIVINTAGGSGIPDDPKIDATMGIIYNGEGIRNYMTDSFNEYNGNIGIETRGSSSQSFPKKQWGLETRDPSGVRFDVTIFNMAYDNDWILYAPYSDKSLIRNVLAYQMAWDSDRFAPRTKLCEVVLNGQYEGVYVFTEKIKRKDGKVGSNDLETVDISGNELTGDYILKVDKTTAGGIIAWTSPFPPYSGAGLTTRFQMHDPDYDSLVPVQLNYIQNYITNFEAALNGPNFADPNLGYLPYVDVGSFIDFFLINEMSKNVDGYRISSFLHKVRTSEGGKLIAGPVWDFNLAFGNANYCQGDLTSGWEIDFYQYCGGGGLQNPFWWEKLVQDPFYTNQLNCHYREMRLGKWHTDSLMARIDTLALFLNESQQRNFQRWPILGTYIWPNNFIGNTYAEEIAYLKQWITNRLTWLDANMFGSCPNLGVDELKTNQFAVFPNPATNYIEVSSNSAILNEEILIYNQLGKLVVQQKILKTETIDISHLEKGMYFYKIVDNAAVKSTGKLIIQ
ncbi:MAG: CotH kinase family protein [Fluviicola sp.]|nr:CotH kinase family protein [Fluviicola sp.]